MRESNSFGALVLIATLASCSGADKLDIGDDGPASNLGARLSDYKGSWSGYAEGIEFADSTDFVRLSLDASGAGTLEVGADVTPSPPDPDGGSPVPALGEFPLIPGYAYSVSEPVLSNSRLQLSASSLEPNQAYCALQTPVFDTYDDVAPHYYCLPRASSQATTPDNSTCSIGPVGDPLAVVPCAKLACYTSCDCTATACAASSTGSNLRLDAVLEGKQMIGTLVNGPARVTIRLERD